MKSGRVAAGGSKLRKRTYLDHVIHTCIVWTPHSTLSGSYCDSLMITDFSVRNHMFPQAIVLLMSSCDESSFSSHDSSRSRLGISIPNLNVVGVKFSGRHSIVA